MGQHPNPDRNRDEHELEELGTLFYQGTGLSVRALTAEELQQFLELQARPRAQQPLCLRQRRGRTRGECIGEPEAVLLREVAHRLHAHRSGRLRRDPDRPAPVLEASASRPRRLGGRKRFGHASGLGRIVRLEQVLGLQRSLPQLVRRVAFQELSHRRFCRRTRTAHDLGSRLEAATMPVRCK